jgi:hypothetical protein
MLPIECACGYVVRGDLISGRTSSLGVVYGLGHTVYRLGEPEYYWMLMGLYSLQVLVTGTLCISQLFGIAADEVSRGSTVAERGLLWGAGVAYGALFSLMCLYLFGGLAS